MNDGFDSTLGAAASRRRVCFIRVGTRRRDAGAPGRSGFTLIEMMVVLVLIGILSAMILPEMKGTYGDALLRSSARDLVNVFSIASSRAVSLNQLHVVRINAPPVATRSSGRARPRAKKLSSPLLRTFPTVPVNWIIGLLSKFANQTRLNPISRKVNKLPCQPIKPRTRSLPVRSLSIQTEPLRPPKSCCMTARDSACGSK